METIAKSGARARAVPHARAPSRPPPDSSRSKEPTATSACSHAAISSTVKPAASASSDTVGERPVLLSSSLWMRRTRTDRSLTALLTLTAPSSRRKRRISPAILGTA